TIPIIQVQIVDRTIGLMSQLLERRAHRAVGATNGRASQRPTATAAVVVQCVLQGALVVHGLLISFQHPEPGDAVFRDLPGWPPPQARARMQNHTGFLRISSAMRTACWQRRMCVSEWRRALECAPM